MFRTFQGFRVLGFRGFGVRVLGFRVWGVRGLGFRVWLFGQIGAWAYRLQTVLGLKR